MYDIERVFSITRSRKISAKNKIALATAHKHNRCISLLLTIIHVIILIKVNRTICPSPIYLDQVSFSLVAKKRKCLIVDHVGPSSAR